MTGPDGETGVFHPEARLELLLDLHDRRPEIYRGPNQGAYAERILLGVGETISPLAIPGLRVVIDALLP